MTERERRRKYRHHNVSRTWNLPYYVVWNSQRIFICDSGTRLNRGQFGKQERNAVKEKNLYFFNGCWNAFNQYVFNTSRPSYHVGHIGRLQLCKTNYKFKPKIVVF